jgi:ribose transport system ATP-binding protein
MLRGVQLSFGPTRALAGVDLEAHAGDVHAVLGENGAGKSTLMRVLAGVAIPDSGAIELDGSPWRPRGPADARRRGLAMVHQGLALCPHSTSRPTSFWGSYRRALESSDGAMLNMVARL